MRKPIAALTAVHTDVAPSTAWARSGYVASPAAFPAIRRGPIMELCGHDLSRSDGYHSCKVRHGRRGAEWSGWRLTAFREKGHAGCHFASCSGFGSECSLARGESQSLQACADNRRATSLVCAARSRASFSTACLDRWTRKGTVRTKYATVPGLRLKPCAASFAVIEELAGVGRHCFRRTMATVRASDC